VSGERGGGKEEDGKNKCRRISVSAVVREMVPPDKEDAADVSFIDFSKRDRPNGGQGARRSLLPPEGEASKTRFVLYQVLCSHVGRSQGICEST